MTNTNFISPTVLASAGSGKVRGSALAALMRLMETSGPLRINFEDLVGMTYDHPELRLPDAMRQHTSPVCQWAKQHVIRGHGFKACVATKYLANRQVQRRGGPVTGVCHMGLTDICHPLVYRYQLMGIFYFGSVLLNDHVDDARRRAIQTCREQQLDVAEALQALDQVPVITREQLAEYEQRLAELVHLTVLMLDGLGLPTDCYHPLNRACDARAAFGGTPRLVVRAIRFISQHHDQPLDLAAIAARLNCHPAYLSRLFRKAMKTTVRAHLERVRVAHACKLLRMRGLDVTRVAYEVGYTDKSNFGRAFRRIMGMSPGAYRRQFQREVPNQVP